MTETVCSGTAARQEIEGGYRLIGARELSLAWWLYRERQIRYADLRAYLGCHELLARRCTMRRGRVPRFTVAELGGVTALSEKSLRAALRRLERAGLLGWAASALRFPGRTPVLPAGAAEKFREFLALIPNHRRLVPVPRRVLRLLASAARPALAATVFAQLLRCLYSQGGWCSARGRCKASWIAGTFGVALSRVKAARKELIAAGWLVPLEAGQWALNRWGMLAEINLDWGPGTATAGVSRCPPTDAGLHKMTPPGALSGPQTGPPESNKDLPKGASNQDLGPPEPAGVQGRWGRLPPPSLKDIRPEDLQCFSRTEALYWQAVRQKLVRHSESGALNWLGAAVRAKCVAGDPVRVFAGIVRRNLWNHVTNEQEDRARRALNRYRELNPDRFRAPTHACARGPGGPLRESPSPSLGRVLARPVRLTAGRASVVRGRHVLEPGHHVLVDVADESAAEPEVREALMA